MRFELMTSSLPRRRSTPELRGPVAQVINLRFSLVQVSNRQVNNLSWFGAGDETRTRDPQLGRLMLYQLSYTRPSNCGLRNSNCGMPVCTCSSIRNPQSEIVSGAGGRIRTYVGQ